MYVYFSTNYADIIDVFNITLAGISVVFFERYIVTQTLWHKHCDTNIVSDIEQKPKHGSANRAHQLVLSFVVFQ